MEIQIYACENCGRTRQFGTGMPENLDNKPRLKCACSPNLQTFKFVCVELGEWTDFKQGALLAA